MIQFPSILKKSVLNPFSTSRMTFSESKKHECGHEICLKLLSKGYIIQNDITEVKNMSGKDNISPIERNRNAAKELDGQEFVDQIPLEDLKIQMEDERKKFKTKDDSQSERKYKRNDHK